MTWPNVHTSSGYLKYTLRQDIRHNHVTQYWLTLKRIILDDNQILKHLFYFCYERLINISIIDSLFCLSNENFLNFWLDQIKLLIYQLSNIYIKNDS